MVGKANVVDLADHSVSTEACRTQISGGSVNGQEPDEIGCDVQMETTAIRRI